MNDTYYTHPFDFFSSCWFVHALKWQRLAWFWTIDEMIEIGMHFSINQMAEFRSNTWFWTARRLYIYIYICADWSSNNPSRQHLFLATSACHCHPSWLSLLIARIRTRQVARSGKKNLQKQNYICPTDNQMRWAENIGEYMTFQNYCWIYENSYDVTDPMIILKSERKRER